MNEKTFLIGYEKPVFREYTLTKVISFQYHRNKNGKLYKVYDKKRWL